MIGAVDEAARALGLRPGGPVAQAQACVPGLAVVEADPDGDRTALETLAAWCLRYSPVVQADRPDGVLLDVAGASHLWGGEGPLLADLVRRVEGAGFAARAAIADTPGAAAATARHGPGGIVPAGGTAAALAPLPIAALRLPDETVRGLGLLGIERIGQLPALPRAPLALRFGPAVFDRYERALGLLPDPLTPLVPRTRPEARLAFPEPLGDAAGLAAATGRLAADLCRELERRAEGLRALDALFRRVDGHPLGFRVGTAMPTRDPRHLLRLLGERLDGIDPGFGIDEVRLVASRTEPLGAGQTEADMAGAGMAGGGPARDAAALAPLVDRLAVRLGARRVFRAMPVESRVPERSVRRVPALAPASGGTWPIALPRPSRIIDPPEEVQATALLPDYPPTVFTWRRVRFVVRAADGPERVHGEWWRSDGEADELRDYYRVEVEGGRRFWLFRHRPAPTGTRWWLHGRFA